MVWVHPKATKIISSTTGALAGARSWKPSKGIFFIIPLHLRREGVSKNVVVCYTLSIVLFIKMPTFLFFPQTKEKSAKIPKVEVCNPITIFLTFKFSWDCKFIGNY